MIRKERIVVVGRITLDVLINIPEFPANGLIYIGDKYSIQAGGTALNIANVLSILNQEVTLGCVVGTDIAGRIVRSMLDDLMIEQTYVKSTNENQTSISIINIGEDFDIGVLHYEGANKSLSPHDLTEIDLSNAKVFHVGGLLLLPGLDGLNLGALLEEVKSDGLITSATLTRNTARKDDLYSVLPNLDWIFMNRKEAKEITGHSDVRDSIEWFHANGVETTVITLGPEGVIMSSSDYEGEIPGFVVSEVDTTGCGDAFSAGFIYARLQGYDGYYSALWGNAIAAMCATNLGGIMPPFRAKDVIEVIETYPRVVEA